MPNVISNPKVEREMTAASLASAISDAVALDAIHALKVGQIVYEVLTANDPVSAAGTWAMVLRWEQPEGIAAYSYAAEVEAAQIQASAPPRRTRRAKRLPKPSAEVN